MNEKRKIPLAEIILVILVIGGLIFLVVKSLLSAKATEKKPEIEPTDTGTENKRKPTVVPVVSEPISVPPAPEIPLPGIIPNSILHKKSVAGAFPHKRKIITWDDMANAFDHGSRKLTLTAAVAALKNLGFGKTAAYAALTPDGRFSAWLRFAPDGIITWRE
jgi:hypothetical protein